MIGDWKIAHLPRCTHHVFLSHCAEDRDRLIKPVYDELQNHKFLPWLDVHQYPAGQDPFEALREGILACRHMVSFVTARSLAQGRGWNNIENAYSTLLQENLRFHATELCHVHLPLFFVPQGHPVLVRSAWGPHLPRGLFYPGHRVDAGSVQWAATKIKEFVSREERRGVSLAAQVQNDPMFQPRLKSEPNFLRRIMCADPPLIP